MNTFTPLESPAACSVMVFKATWEPSRWKVGDLLTGFTAIGEDVIMVTLFDDKTSLGLIRLRINQIIDELSRILSPIFEKRELQ
jgi:hypothetical protein